MATPFMALTLPTPGVTNDLTGEQQTMAALTTIDSHDHTSGKGVSVPVSGLNINADLSLTTAGTNFNLTGARAVRLVNLSATPTASTDINELVDSGGNLYWMNSSGQAVQITAGAALSATSLGGISGLPSGTASASFGSQTFTWRSATNTAAIMDAGPVLIRDTALGAVAITLASPAGLGGAYTLTLPSTLPGSNALLSLATNGALSAFGTVSGSDLTIAGNQIVSGNLTSNGSVQTFAGNISLSIASQCVISVTAANAQVQIKGNKTGADTGTDVLTNTAATRTAGNLFQVNNNGTAKLNVDYQGLLTLPSQAAPIQPAAYVTALTVTASWVGTNGVAYWKDASGLVRVKGTISDGIVPASNPAFTFPAGFRPSAQRQFSCPGAPAAGGTSNDIWQVTAAGALNLVTTHTALDAHFVDGISFLAEA